MKYSKIDIKRIIRQLIYYFEIQEFIPTQEEEDTLLNQIRDSIKQKKRKKQMRQLWISVASTAAIITLVWFGVDRFRFEKTEQDITMVAAKMSNEKADSNEIQLIISPKETISLKQGTTVAYSQNGEISIDEGRKITDNAVGEDMYNQIIVPKGKHMQLILSDGSSLHINSGTKVVYPKHFKKDKREIYVDGEIYIDVKQNNVPFFVKTAKFEVEVLGTKFNVSSYETDNYAEIVLVKGSVKLKDNQDKTLLLSPNQLATIENGYISGKKQVNAQDYIAWINGLLVFNSESLEKVFYKLERYYGDKIDIDPAIKNLSVRGTLDLNCPIEEILNRIAIGVPIKYEKTEKGFFVTKKD